MPRRNCNTPQTCSLDVVGALPLLSGTTAQCDPQALERNQGSLIVDDPAGIMAKDGSDDQPIFLPRIGQNSHAAQGVVVIDANGRLRVIQATPASGYGVPVYQAGAVTIRDLAFVLQNFNASSVGNVGNCDFEVAVWSQCTASSPLALKKITFTDLLDKIATALETDETFIATFASAFCSKLPNSSTMTSLWGCFNGVGSQILAGSGPKDLVAFNGVFQTIARGLAIYPGISQLISVSSPGTYTAPPISGWPTVIPNGQVYAIYWTQIGVGASTIINVSTNGGASPIGHLESEASGNLMDMIFFEPVVQAPTITVQRTSGAAGFTVLSRVLALIY